MFKYHDIKGMINEISLLMEENKKLLCELDGVLGDGDVGITMSRGFSSLVEFNNSDSIEDNIGILFKKYGLIFADKAPSTMGTLLASAFMKSGKSLEGKSELTL